MLSANELVGTHDIALITLDTLRYDVAVAALSAKRTPNIQALLPGGEWERRQSPATFTFAAHQAFLAGFLPTPDRPGVHPRHFAMRFEGSESTAPTTCVLDAPDLASGLRARGYHTLCIGGVGFFDKRTPLGRVIPNMFEESHWDPTLGVTDRESTRNQVRVARQALERLPAHRRVFLLLNVSALHQPNCIFSEGAARDTSRTMEDALAYVDAHVGELLAFMRRRAPLFLILTSDHGTAYGEQGYQGHRNTQQVVWRVPYAEAVLDRLE